MKPILFRGVATALVTPFSGGRVDTAALKRLVRYQISHGIDALVIAGTTGEAPTLSAKEKLHSVAAAAEEAGGRVPILAGTETNDTKASLRLSRAAVREGADGILAVTPYYNRPTEAGLTAHYLTLAEGVGKPILLYDVPSRTGSALTDPVCDPLADHPMIAGIKDASGKVALAAERAARYDGRLAIYSGCDELTLPILSVGGQGVVSVMSNLLPSEVRALCRLYWEGRQTEALALYRAALPLCRALFAETNPIPVKAAMERLGFCSAELRLPLTPAAASTVRRLRESLLPLMG